MVRSLALLSAGPAHAIVGGAPARKKERSNARTLTNGIFGGLWFVKPEGVVAPACRGWPSHEHAATLGAQQ